jgi:hypothetical protein
MDVLNNNRGARRARAAAAGAELAAGIAMREHREREKQITHRQAAAQQADDQRIRAADDQRIRAADRKRPRPVGGKRNITKRKSKKSWPFSWF